MRRTHDRAAWRAAAAALAAGWLACESPPPPAAPEPPARVAVEVLRGFSPEDAAPSEHNAPVVVLLDATRSMLAPTRQRTSHAVAAERAAIRFANNVPALRPLWLYVMGSVSSGCQGVARGARASSAAARGPLLEELSRQRPVGEASLAVSLEQVYDELWRADALLGSRVVVFSDLGEECGGDVCAAAQRLVEGGARLDVVAIGDAGAPACLREPASLAEALPPPRSAERPTHFRLELSEPEPMVAGCSEAGGLPVAVPAGPGSVVVELDPPLRVDAHFAAGSRHVLQVLDFPSLDPPRRQWRWLDGAQRAEAPAPVAEDPIPTQFGATRDFDAPRERVWEAALRTLAGWEVRVARSDPTRGLIVAPSIAIEPDHAVHAPLGHTRGAPHTVVRREGRLLLALGPDQRGGTRVGVDVAMRIRVQTGNRDQHIAPEYQWREARSTLVLENELLDAIGDELAQGVVASEER